VTRRSPAGVWLVGGRCVPAMLAPIAPARLSVAHDRGGSGTAAETSHLPIPDSIAMMRVLAPVLPRCAVAE
jgi:hypothetical protein